jgi:hypothetical protein
MQGSQNLGNWDERSRGAPRLDKIAETLEEMYTRGREPEIGNAFAVSSSPAPGRAVSGNAGHEWAGSSRDSINAMLSSMTISERENVTSEYDWYEHDEIPMRKSRAGVLIGILVGFVTVGIAGYGFYMLGQKEAVLGSPEVVVAEMSPGIAAPGEAVAPKETPGGDLALGKDLSRIADGEKAHLSAEPDSTGDTAPAGVDSATSLKTDLQPAESLKEVLSDSGQAGRGGAKADDAAKGGGEPGAVKRSGADVAPASAARDVSRAPDVKSPNQDESGKSVAGDNPGSPVKAPAVSQPAGFQNGPMVPAKPPAKLAEIPKVAGKNAGLSKEPDAASSKTSVEVSKAPVAVPAGKPVVQGAGLVSLDSLSKSVVLAIVALGKPSKASTPGENPAAVLRDRMMQLVAESRKQGKPLEDVELMLEHALAGVPTGTIPDVLKDVQGKVNVKMLLSSLSPVQTTR